MANRIRAITGLSASASVFNPSSLFYNAELGFIENLLGSSTLFQDSAGTTPAVLGSVIGRINSANGSGVYASQATTAKKPILKRMPTSGVRNLLSDSDDIYAGVDWSTSSSWSPVQVNRYNTAGSGKSWKLTNDGLAGGRNFNKTLTSGTSSIETVSCIYEKSSNESAQISAVGIYNATSSSFASRLDFEWATKNAVIVAGSGGAVKLASIGQNGGEVYRLWSSGTIPPAVSYRRYLYPCGAVNGTNTHTIIVHSCQHESGGSATNQQITVGGCDVYEPGYNQVYWLDYDGVDDELVLNNPDLGSNATRIRAQLGGPVIEQGLTLGANLTLNTDNLGLILLNRPLTADELAAITNYYTRMVS